MSDLLEPRPLSSTERMFLKTVEKFSPYTEGYVIAFGEEVIRTHGIGGFLSWAKITWTTRRTVRNHFGERNQHLLSSFASFWNGCEYCAQGNLLAHNLLLFRDEGKVFPLDEDEMLQLQFEDDSRVLERIEELLGGAYDEELVLLRRQWTLKSGGKRETEDDRHIWLSMRLYDFINECSIVVPAPAPPFNQVARDDKLLESYRVARDSKRNGSRG